MYFGIGALPKNTMSLQPDETYRIETHIRENPGKRDCVMIRTAIISMLASFVLVGVWTINLVSYHPATDLNPIAPLSTNFD